VLGATDPTPLPQNLARRKILFLFNNLLPETTFGAASRPFLALWNDLGAKSSILNTQAYNLFCWNIAISCPP